MQKTKLPFYEMISLALGEIIVSAIVAVVFLCISQFTYAVYDGKNLCLENYVEGESVV